MDQERPPKSRLEENLSVSFIIPVLTSVGRSARPNPRRVIMVGRWRPDSANGVDKTIVNLSRELLRLGCAITLWNPTRKTASIRENRIEPGISQFELPVFSGGLRVQQPTCDFIKAESAKAWLAHFHCAFTPANNAIAARLRCPYTLTPNGPYSPAAFNARTWLKKKVWIALSERSYLNRAAFIHALSEYEVAAIQRLCQQKHFVIAPNGIPLEKTPFPRPSFSTAQNSRTILFLGRLAVHHKGLDFLLPAFAKAKVPGWQLVLAGPDFRGGQAALLKLARKLGINQQVQFVGPVYGEEKWKLMEAADLFVHTSRWEGIPFAVLEAMSLGKPVVVSPGTNLGGYIRERRGGWIAEEPDFAIGLKEALLASANELQNRGARARELILQEFQWPTIAQKVFAGYERYCEQRQS
jgi:glycosyltransferase involved in cell wall biosynthesis